jgi:hypothetical protein
MVRRLVVASVAIAGWATLVLCGELYLWRFQLTAGATGETLKHWPKESNIRRQDGLFTLLLFLHPKCPCSQASFDSAAQVAARAQGKLNLFLVFVKPAGSHSDWEKTDLWKQGKATPGCTVLTDEAGREAQKFGVKTSGHVLLYDPAGQLLFSGGLTSARGQPGPSAGLEAVVHLLNGESVEESHGPVYGCPLLDAASSEEGEETTCHQ